VAVELAIIGAPFLLMILEIFQSALFVYYSGMLNHATESAARQILVGSVQNGSLTQTQFINNLLCPLLPAAMSCGNVIVNLQKVSEAGYPGGFYAFVPRSSFRRSTTRRLLFVRVAAVIMFICRSFMRCPSSFRFGCPR